MGKKEHPQTHHIPIPMGIPIPTAALVHSERLRCYLDDTEEGRVLDGGDVVSVEVLDPDMARAGQARHAGRVAGLVAGVRGRCVGVGGGRALDHVDGRPALQVDVVADHHRETAASRRVVVQQLNNTTTTQPYDATNCIVLNTDVGRMH